MAKHLLTSYQPSRKVPPRLPDYLKFDYPSEENAGSSNFGQNPDHNF